MCDLKITRERLVLYEWQVLSPFILSCRRNQGTVDIISAYNFILTYPNGRISPFFFNFRIIYISVLILAANVFFFLNLGPECRLKRWKMCSGRERLFRGHSMLLECESLQGKKSQHNLEIKPSTNTVDLDGHKKGSQQYSRCLFCGCCPWFFSRDILYSFLHSFFTLILKI